jgi:hypothetical protein
MNNITNKPAPGPPQVQVDPVDIFARFFGFGLMQLRALGVNVVPCMCGKCHGFAVQLDHRMHILRTGGVDMFPRPDIAKPEEPKA